MGDLEGLTIQPDGFLIDDTLFLPPISPLLSNPSPASISEECWQIAEETTEGIIRLIQPTVVSEQRRKEVIEYVQGLINSNLGSEVFPFGSVPLKTYLPDGDIDLTALISHTVEDSLANEVRAVLEREEHNKDPPFEVKDVQYIHAEVKLIKCLVQNIVVDISFNQVGGICTLCFLEQVDRLIGKDHLFKRSIILIKAWCYYESRILGAHHGLISTYALETMVLYIFHLFHSSLDGPLAVLYRFLDYYSKFDWDKYCISLYGPAPISSLPEISAETPDNDGGELLLEKDFLRDCADAFSVPSRGFDSNSKSFPQKSFNIVDPLKDNNNLGRSVSKGNFYRIRSAFTYGARKLGQILLLRVDDIRDELKKFFMNTLDRHGSGQRPDVPVPSPKTSSASSESEGPTTENGVLSQRRISTGLVSSLKVLERLGYIKEGAIVDCPLVGDSSKLVINSKVDSSGEEGVSTASDGSSNDLSEESVETPEPLLPDLSGDYESHVYSLLCARANFGGEPYLHFAPPHSSEFQNTQQNTFDTYQGPMHYAADDFSHMNGVYQGPPHYYHQLYPSTVFGVEDAPGKHRGTGTYLPNMHNGGVSYRERYSLERRRNGPHNNNNNQYVRPLRENNWAGRHGPPPQHYQTEEKPLPAPPGFVGGNGFSHQNQNGSTPALERVKFGSFVQFPPLPTSKKQPPAVSNNKQQQHTSNAIGGTSSSSPVSSVEGRKPKEFHLKNEADFPPLGVAGARSSSNSK